MKSSRHPDSEAVAEATPSLLAQQHLIGLRCKGMHMVRFEFIRHLLQISAQTTTLSIYWEDGRNFFQVPIVENTVRKLVFASTPRVSGKFDDMSLISYDHDAQAKAVVDAELDRMIAVIEAYWQKQS